MKYIKTQYTWQYTICDLSGAAALYECRTEGVPVLYKFIDEEHGITGGGWFSYADAKKNFAKKIKELAA